MTSRAEAPPPAGQPPTTRGPGRPRAAGRACAGGGVPRPRVVEVERVATPAGICQCDCEWAFASAAWEKGKCISMCISAGRGAFSLLGSERVGAVLEAEPPSPRLGGARGSVGEV